MSGDVVADALLAGDDAAGALLWRQVCATLAGPLRIGLLGRDEALLRRAALHLGAGADWVPIVVGSEVSAELEVQDRLLGLHAALFVTPVTAPLGAAERAWLAALGGLGAPSERVVVVGDGELLAQLSDHPEREAEEVAARVASLVPDGWQVGDEASLAARVSAWRAGRDGLQAERRSAVGALLLRDALRRAEAAAAAARAELAGVEASIAAEDARLDAAARQGARAAAHLLSAAVRQTERLLIDLSSFLARLEAALPDELAAVDDLDLLRRALPHWLHHVVEAFLSERVAGWRVDLDADLADLDLDPAALARADLLAPAVHAHVPPSSTGWGKRLGVTAAVGGGAALLVFGMWIPGLLAVSGGALFSALGREAEVAGTRRALLDAATAAVRRMGADADRLLRDQLRGLETSIALLSDEARAGLAAERAAVRADLDRERVRRADRARDAASAVDRLRRALGDPS